MTKELIEAPMGGLHFGYKMENLERAPNYVRCRIMRNHETEIQLAPPIPRVDYRSARTWWVPGMAREPPLLEKEGP